MAGGAWLSVTSARLGGRTRARRHAADEDSYRVSAGSRRNNPACDCVSLFLIQGRGAINFL